MGRRGYGPMEPTIREAMLLKEGMMNTNTANTNEIHIHL